MMIDGEHTVTEFEMKDQRKYMKVQKYKQIQHCFHFLRIQIWKTKIMFNVGFSTERFRKLKHHTRQNSRRVNVTQHNRQNADTIMITVSKLDIFQGEPVRANCCRNNAE